MKPLHRLIDEFIESLEALKEVLGIEEVLELVKEYEED